MKIAQSGPLSIMGSSRRDAVREEGRLSLGKGEGEGEGSFGATCCLLAATPHLYPLPFPNGRGGRPDRLPRKI
jgi:hypothetical protein